MRYSSCTAAAIEIHWLPEIVSLLEHLQIYGFLLAHSFEAVDGFLDLFVESLKRGHVDAWLALWLVRGDCSWTRLLLDRDGTAADFILITWRCDVLHVIGSREFGTLVAVVRWALGRQHDLIGRRYTGHIVKPCLRLCRRCRVDLARRIRLSLLEGSIQRVHLRRIKKCLLVVLRDGEGRHLG